MPWRIVHGHGGCSRSRPYAVVKEGSGEKVGCHPSRAKATAHLKALYASERRKNAAYAMTPEVIPMDEDTPATTPRAFQAVLTVEGERTSDGRRIAPGALRWRTPPIPLLYQRQTKPGHEESIVVGKITDIGRVGHEIRGTGIFDNSPDADEAWSHVESQTQRWVSVDMETPESFELMEEEDGRLTAEFRRARLMGACYDDETEVLTEHRGWQRFAGLTQDDRVATRNPKTAEFEWQLPFSYTNDAWGGPMIHFTSGGVQGPDSNPLRRHRQLDLLVTPNHRMFVISTSTGEPMFMRADELAQKSHRSYKIPTTSSWLASDVPFVTIEAERWGRSEPLSIEGDWFAGFMGAWLSEGSTNRASAAVHIAQREESKGYELFAELFADSPIHVRREVHGWIISDVRLSRFLKQFGRAPQKFVPQIIKEMSVRQLRIFWDHFVAGDGDAEGRRLYTSSPRLAEDLQEIAQKSGMWAVVSTREQHGNILSGRKIVPNGPQYIVAVRNREGSRAASSVGDWKAEHVECHVGMVRCVSVPNEALYVRRNGIPAWCGNTIVAFPAFPTAVIAPADYTVPEPTADGRGEATPTIAFLAAAASRPPVSWFSNPELPKLTPITITDDGHLYGHAAPWGQCHVGFDGVCVTAPSSRTNYAYFLLGETRVDDCDCDAVPTGVITMDTNHARPPLSAISAAEHYERTGLVVADIAVGEDSYGIWVSGRLRSTLTDDQIDALRSAKLSGDWRNVNGNLELVALLAVNTPGFPVPRLAASVEGGRQMSLVAAITPDEDEPTTVIRNFGIGDDTTNPNGTITVINVTGIDAEIAGTATEPELDPALAPERAAEPEPVPVADILAELASTTVS